MNEDIIINTQILAKTIKNFRTSNNIKAKEFIEYFNKSQSYLCKLEKGEIKKFSIDILINLLTFNGLDKKQSIEKFLEIAKIEAPLTTEDWMITLDNHYKELYKESFLNILDKRKISGTSVNNMITEGYNFALMLEDFINKINKVHNQEPEYVEDKVQKLLNNMDIDLSFMLALFTADIKGINELSLDSKKKLVKDTLKLIKEEIEKNKQNPTLSDYLNI